MTLTIEEAYVAPHPRRGMPPLDKIAAHWHSQPEQIRRTLRSQYTAGATALNTRRHYLGWREPFCFACGWMPPVKVAERHKSWKAWNTASKWLDRAHLIDHSLGGSSEPGNLAPICHLCHDGMPPFTEHEPAWEWVINHSQAEWEWQLWTDVAFQGKGRQVSRNTTLIRSRMKFLEFLRDENNGAA